MPRPRTKTRLRGVDPEYVLAVIPAKKGAAPTRFLTDTVAHPAEKPETTQLTKARVWADPSGPRHFLARHPKLRKRFVAFPVLIGVPASSAA
jgi:hypothetical protein